MARIKIELPGQFHFSCSIPVRITDINYGGHVGNDTVLSIIHEARIQYLRSFGYTEMEFAGLGMIMADAAIEFKNELFYGDVIFVSVMAQGFTKISFDLLYKLEKETDGKRILVAVAKTGMVCYDYPKKKIAAIPENAKRKLSSQ
jgi:acyl-CoA thioester hydrolase